MAARRTIIELSERPFNADAIAAAFRQGSEEAGAIVTFLGQVSREDDTDSVISLHLDHMPDATLA